MELQKAERAARLEALIAAHGDAILRLCFSLLLDRQLAEDAAQETFFHAWRALDGFSARRGCSESTWLSRIAVNVCRDFARAPWRRHVDLSRALEDLPPAALPASEEDRTLFLTVLSLPEKYRAAVLLCDVRGMTLAEAARALSLPRSTVHHRLRRAHETLRRMLTEEV